jgi:hypothetical protein
MQQMMAGYVTGKAVAAEVNMLSQLKAQIAPLLGACLFLITSWSLDGDRKYNLRELAPPVRHH